MADIYAVVDKSKKKNRSPCKEESTVGAFMSPLYDAVEADLESRSVLVDNEGLDAEYSVLTRDGVYPRGLPAGTAATTAHGTNQIAGKYKSISEDVSCKRFICILVTITLVTLISLVCLAVLFAEIAKLKSQSVSPQQTSSSQQIQNESVFMLQLQQINKSLTSIQDQITTLSREEMENNAAQSNNIQQLNTSIDMQLSTLHNQTQQLSDSNTMLQQQLTTLHNQTQQLSDFNTMLKHQLTTLHNQTQLLSDSNTMLQQQLDTALFAGQLSIYPATSCAALPPSSPSGHYWISNSNDSPTLVYCTISCGTHTGGWMRVGFLNMTNSSHQCPSGFMKHNESPNIRTCVRKKQSGGCTKVELSRANTPYTRACGRITAYQVGSVDGFTHDNINSVYVDGISLTHGTSAGRQHIWSFAAIRRSSRSNCIRNLQVSSVGDDYFYGVANPMWCTGSDGCCTTPYFLKTLPQPTTDDIEMRVCRNERRDNEDIAIETVEIYVQ